MSQVYSKRLLHSHSGAAASYTVPDDTVTIVRCITAFNPNALLPETAAVVITGLALTIWQVGNLGGASLSVGDSVTVEMRVVLHAGESIHAVTDGDIDLTVSGYELTATS